MLLSDYRLNLLSDFRKKLFANGYFSDQLGKQVATCHISYLTASPWTFCASVGCSSSMLSAGSKVKML